MGKTKNYSRDKDDYFKTPEDCLKAFLKVEKKHLPPIMWECACGDGAIATRMPKNINVLASDLVDRGYGQSGIDFLMEYKKWADAIITNPPWKLLYEFIEHAFDLEVDYIAYLMQASFLSTAGWADLFERRRPTVVYFLSWRPDVFGIGQPDQRCCLCWVVWRGYNWKATRFEIMRKPKGLPE